MQMENWAFPTVYDESYLPPANSRYWFPVRETMPAADRERAILVRLRRSAPMHTPMRRSIAASGTGPAFTRAS